MSRTQMLRDRIKSLYLTEQQISSHLGIKKDLLKDYMWGRKKMPHKYVYALSELLELELVDLYLGF